MGPILSEESIKWLSDRDHTEFQDYFLNLDEDEDQRKIREQSLELACLWCQVFEKEEDGKELNEKLSVRLLELIEPIEEDEGADYIRMIWQDMCGHYSTYRFAKIDEFHFTGALYGVFRTLLPDELDIEPFYSNIREFLLEILLKDHVEGEEIGYGILNKGLQSEVVLLPNHNESWTDHCDQYRIMVLE